MKIEKLTEEQEKRLAVFREEWRAIGLAPGRVQLDIARPVWGKMYKAIGSEPVPVFTFPSPMAAVTSMPVVATIMNDVEKIKKRILEIFNSKEVQDNLANFESKLRKTIAANLVPIPEDAEFGLPTPDFQRQVAANLLEMIDSAPASEEEEVKGKKPKKKEKAKK